MRTCFATYWQKKAAFRERRELFEKGRPEAKKVFLGGSAEMRKRSDFGAMTPVDMNEFDMSIAKNRGRGTKDIKQMTTPQLVAQFRGAVGRYYNSVLRRFVPHRLATEARILARGNHLETPIDRSAKMSIEQQMSDFDQVIQDSVEHVYRIAENQTGSLKYLKIFQTAWNIFWDQVQDHPDFSYNHPLFMTDQWKGNMRVPGTYWNGKLSQISPNMIGNRERRKRSPEATRFERRPHGELFEDHVRLKHRDQVFATVAHELQIKDQDTFNRLEWGIPGPGVTAFGDDAEGLSHVYMVHKPGGLKDEGGTYLPGEAPTTGMVHVYGHEDDPSQTEVVYVNFDEVDDMLAVAENYSLMRALITRPGFLNEGLARLGADLMRNLPAEGNRNNDFYAQRIITRLLILGPEIRNIVEAMESIGFTEEDIDWLWDLNISEDESAAKLQRLGTMISESGKHDLWKRVVQSYAPGFVAANGRDWYEKFLFICGVGEDPTSASLPRAGSDTEPDKPKLPPLDLTVPPTQESVREWLSRGKINIAGTILVPSGEYKYDLIYGANTATPMKIAEIIASDYLVGVLSTGFVSGTFFENLRFPYAEKATLGDIIKALEEDLRDITEKAVDYSHLSSVMQWIEDGETRVDRIILSPDINIVDDFNIIHGDDVRTGTRIGRIHLRNEIIGSKKKVWFQVIPDGESKVLAQCTLQDTPEATIEAIRMLLKRLKQHKGIP